MKVLADTHNRDLEQDRTLFFKKFELSSKIAYRLIEVADLVVDKPENLYEIIYFTQGISSTSSN